MNADTQPKQAKTFESTRTVFYLEDNEVVRESIATMLRFAGYRVAEFATPTTFLAGLDQADHSINGHALVLLDMRLNDQVSGLDVFRQLKKRLPLTAGIFLSGDSKVSEAIDAMKAGAFDFLLKPVGRAELLDALERCFQHLELGSTSQPGERYADIRMFGALTRRENDVLVLFLKGQRGREIARELAISERTVKIHRGNIMKKLGARSLAQLAALHQRYLLRQESKRSADMH